MKNICLFYCVYHIHNVYLYKKLKHKDMATQNITIETVNYLGHDNSINFNAKVLYRKNGKLYLAHVDIDFFNKRVYIPKQAKECKVLKGFEQAINQNQGF